MELKKLLLGLSASALLLAACDDDTGTDNEETDTEDVEETPDEDVSANEETEDTDEVEEDEADDSEEESANGEREIVLGEPIDFEEFEITIQSYSISQDYDGDPALIVTYDWVNTSDDSASPFMTFNLKGFQNNVETGDSFMVDDVDLGIGQREVRPEGEVTGAQTTVGIDDMDAPLELELDILFSFADDTSYVTTLDLSEIE